MFYTFMRAFQFQVIDDIFLLMKYFFLGSGCSSVVELLHCNQDVVGSTPAELFLFLLLSSFTLNLTTRYALALLANSKCKHRVVC